MIKNFISTLLFFHIITAATPTISSFNYQIDMPAVETLIKKEWSALFWMPNYDQNLINIIFKDRRPGDIMARNQYLFIDVLKEDSKLIGFITYYQANNNTGHIELLAVDKQYKGLGYGKKLVHDIQNWFSRLGCKYLQLYVYTTNQYAIQFYKHLGFTVKNIFPTYLLLSKQIGS